MHLRTGDPASDLGSAVPERAHDDAARSRPVRRAPRHVAGPDGRGRLVTTQVGQIPVAQRRLLVDDLRQRNGGVTPSEAEIESEFYLRTITARNRRSYELGYR